MSRPSRCAVRASLLAALLAAVVPTALLPLLGQSAGWARAALLSAGAPRAPLRGPRKALLLRRSELQLSNPPVGRREVLGLLAVVGGMPGAGLLATKSLFSTDASEEERRMQVLKDSAVRMRLLSSAVDSRDSEQIMNTVNRQMYMLRPNIDFFIETYNKEEFKELARKIYLDLRYLASSALEEEWENARAAHAGLMDAVDGFLRGIGAAEKFMGARRRLAAVACTCHLRRTTPKATNLRAMHRPA
eukprot:CAMPEP_0179079434 /NCGR_PEP_ID=MMETSP0796-20121207/35640_1 /TAXON_ID=73915 /ORGANISM="Pyrodinium bahamense, Strain pbaha01" /LENGTH=245 /DNA_ID=CAMNT_0020776769 /DNA_START=15 /DNA_END=750 /DNA_ORIENTATION=-